MKLLELFSDYKVMDLHDLVMEKSWNFIVLVGTLFRSSLTTNIFMLNVSLA